jgi:hypothetical protein
MKRKAPKRIRTALLQIYLSTRELELLKHAAQSQGLPVSTWARVALLEQGSRLSLLAPKRRARRKV